MDTKEYYLDAFVDYLNKNDKSSGTILTYTANIKGFIKYYVESYGEEFILENVIMMDLQDYRNYLLNTTRQKSSTINNKIAALKEYFFFLQSKGIIKDNPAVTGLALCNHLSVVASFRIWKHRTFRKG